MPAMSCAAKGSLFLTCVSVAELMQPRLSFCMSRRALYSLGLLAASLCNACMAVPVAKAADSIEYAQSKSLNGGMM